MNNTNETILNIFMATVIGFFIVCPLIEFSDRYMGTSYLQTLKEGNSTARK